MQDVSTALTQTLCLGLVIAKPRPVTIVSIVVVMEREVTAWFRQQPKEFSAAGFLGLVKQWDKCLNVQGDYAEK
jgi:hypothetical protein